MLVKYMISSSLSLHLYRSLLIAVFLLPVRGLSLAGPHPFRDIQQDNLPYQFSNFQEEYTDQDTHLKEIALHQHYQKMTRWKFQMIQPKSRCTTRMVGTVPYMLSAHMGMASFVFKVCMTMGEKIGGGALIANQ